MKIKCPFCESEKTHLYLKLKDYFLTQEDFQIQECENCNLLFTMPRPDSAEIGKYYKSDDYLSHNEHKKGLVPWLYKRVKRVNIRNKYEMACKGLTNPKLLDFGCGIGDFLLYAKRKGCDITGCDLSEDARSLASEKLGKTIVSPEEIFALPDSTFDIITMWHVLEHVPDLKYHAQQLHRLLKPGGRLVVAVPNFHSFDAHFYKDHWAAYDVPRHLYHFHKESLQNVFDGKFSLETIHPLVWDSLYISMESEKYSGNNNSFIQGIIIGKKSNLLALKSKEYSSLVYVFRKI